jgi:hypothetical protein
MTRPFSPFTINQPQGNTMKNEYETSVERVAYCRNTLGPPKEIRLTRFGDLDLVFEGWEISTVDDAELRQDRATVDVATFFSVKGSYIGEITRHMPNREGPDHPHVQKTKAEAFATPHQLLAWLKEDGRGWLGENSKIAWEEMCSRLPWLNESNAIRV